MGELKELYEKSLKEKKEILAKIKPLRVKEDEILKKLAPLEAELRKTRLAIVKIEGTRLAEVSRTIAALAPNAKRILAEPAKFETKT